MGSEDCVTAPTGWGSRFVARMLALHGDLELGTWSAYCKLAPSPGAVGGRV